MSKGPLFDAIRASISIPTIFTPYEINGRTLVDGGLVNPVPIAPTLRDVTDLTIAVSLSGPPLSSAPAASGKTRELKRCARYLYAFLRDDALAAHAPDVVISIPNNACRFFEFNRAAEMIEIGRRQAAQALSEQIASPDGG